uniref:Peptidase S8/S53 domain-containing protein n=1 Tax=Staphylothermus marinus TaxID=2280 RepID=A0A7J3KFD1_STAMA
MSRYFYIIFLLLILSITTPPIQVFASPRLNVSTGDRFNGVSQLLGLFEIRDKPVLVVDTPGVEVEEPVENSVIHREFMFVIDEYGLDELTASVAKVKYVYRLRDKLLVFAMVSSDQLLNLADQSWLHSIAPSPPIDEIIPERRGIVDRVLDVDVNSASGSGGGIFGSWDIMGIRQAWETYGVSGEGVVVGVVDTGIDFGYQELDVYALARDAFGNPLTAVVDEHIGLSPLNVAAINNVLPVANLWLPVYSTYYSGVYGYPYFYRVRYTVNFTAPSVASKSGIYKFGTIEWFFADYVTGYIIRLRVPFVLIDANTPGVYDTVVFDLSTAFYSLCYTMRLIDSTWRSPNPAWLDYSFADEPVFSLTNPVVARDFDNDGFYDFSLGSIAGVVIDTWGITDYTYDPGTGNVYLGSPGQRLGLDTSGKYIALLTDWDGHGTSVASIIGARGRLDYVGYGGFTYKYYGVAYGAKIAGATGFWFGDLIAAVYWLAGYDYDPEINWFIPSTRRADVVSNSWSYVNLVKWLHQSPGIDLVSLIFDTLVLENPFYTTIVFAAGNSGSGYGTVNSPSTGLFIISVGASTNWEYARIFGMPPGFHDDIAMFSSRGPNALGYPKPDVVAVGCYEWAGVRVIEGRGWGIIGYWEYSVGPGLTLFGGTSEATPFVSGILALGIEALRVKTGSTPDPMVLKTLLKSSSDDIGYPVFIQGAGRVNAYKLIKTIVEGDFVAYVTEGLTNAVFENYYSYYGDYLYELLFFDTSHYAVVPAGSTHSFTVRLELGSGVVSADAIMYTISRTSIVYRGVYTYTTTWITIPRSVWSNADYLEVYVILKNVSSTYPYYGVTPKDRNYAVVLHMYDYYQNSYYVINGEVRYSTVSALSISNPASRVRGELLVRLRPLPGATPPSYAEVEVVAVAYRAVRSSWFSISGIPRYIDGYGEIPVTVSVPPTTRPGVYEFKLRIHTSTKTITIPVSILVPLVIDGSRLYVSLPSSKLPFSYDSYTPIGLTDAWSTAHYSRTEALDWRIIPVLISDYSITGLILQASWSSGSATSLEVVVISPGGVLSYNGDINVYAAYKVTARHGYVYNPNPSDQISGRLKLYIPVRWSMPLRNTIVYYHRDATPTSETVSSISYLKYPYYYGLYRVVISFGSYSGSRLYDTVRLAFSIVKAWQNIECSGESCYVTAYFVTSTVGSPFLGAEIYGLSSETLNNPELNPLIYGYRRAADGSLIVLNKVYGTYLGVSNNPGIVLVSYVTNIGGELDTVLVLNIPWHASGIYYYNGGVKIVETYYKAIVSSSSSYLD